MTEFPWLVADLPAGWSACAIQDFSSVVRGGSPRPKGSPKYFGGKIPFVKISDVTASDRRTLWKTVDTVNEEGALKSRLIEAGRLILSNSGTVCVPVFLGVDACIHDGFVAFDDLPEEVCQKFLYHFFRYIRPFILVKHKQGVTQVNLNTGIVSEIMVALPPTNEQRRIVERIEAMFDEIDHGVENLKKARATLGLYRQSLLKSAFEGRLTADWRARNADKLETPETLLARIQQERDTRYKSALDDWQKALTDWRENGEEGKKPSKPKRPSDVVELDEVELETAPSVPSCWGLGRLGLYIEWIEAGKSFKCLETPPEGDQIGVAKVSAVSWGEYNEAESKTCLDESKVNEDWFIRPGDFLLSRANTIELVGASVIAKTVTKNVMLSDKTLRLHFDSGDPRFFLQYLRSPLGRGEIEQRSTGNQESMRNIGQDRIKNIVLPICCPEEQAEITRILDERLSAADALEAEIDAGLTRAEALRQSILKQAFSGKLVPQDPEDEPAATLLARIKAEKTTKPKKRRASNA